MPEALFLRDGDRYLPDTPAASVWGEDVVHGGAVAALLACGVEAAKPDPALCVVRLTIDLFRAVPREPLELRVTERRVGRRIAALDASLLASGREVTRASALLLLPADLPATASRAPKPRGPEGLETARLHIDAEREAQAQRGMYVASGLARVMEVRWAQHDPDTGPLTAWMRLPLAVVEGEEPTPLQRLAASVDFGSALANRAQRRRAPDAPSFINADISLHLYREPVGEWFCARADRRADDAGIGIVEVSHFDVEGHLGHSTLARLANARG